MKKKKAPNPYRATTRNEASKLVCAIRLNTIHRNKVINARDLQRAQIDKEFGAQLDEIDNDVALQAAALKEWAEANRNEFNDDRGRKSKSVRMWAGAFGFRTNPPSVGAASKSNLKKALNLCLAMARKWVKTSTVHCLDKEAILASYSKVADNPNARPKFEAHLKRCGLRIVRGEQFFVEPDIEAEPTKGAA